MSNHLCLPFADFGPDMKELIRLLSAVEFRPLSQAVPENLPTGSIVVLYNIYTYCFKTVVVERLEDGQLYYCHQTGRRPDTWHHSFIGDPVCFAYLYKVIS